MNPINLAQINNSTVLVRVNYDLPSLESISRIEDSLPTIKLLLSNGNKVVLATHWGRPDGTTRELSTNQFDEILEGLLRENVTFVNQYDSFVEAKAEIRDAKAQIILLENTRFHPEEKSKDTLKRQKLALEYSTLASYFVDEAFAVSHREEATNHDIKRTLPWCLGLSHQREVDNLSKLKENPLTPYIAIMGGAKLETKLELLNKILPKVDKIIVGGMLAFTFVQAKKELGDNNQPEIFDSRVESEFLDTAKELIKNNPNKIITPIDFVYSESEGQKYAFDIGTKTLELFANELEGSKTIFWNGPMGYYEKPPFDQGTINLGKIITSVDNAFTVIGGGDTDSALPEEIVSKIKFVSMGGGATLEFLSK